jgi:hypothetical protein
MPTELHEPVTASPSGSVAASTSLGARTSRDPRAASVVTDGHVPSGAEIDHQSIAQGTTGPIMTAAAH